MSSTSKSAAGTALLVALGAAAAVAGTAFVGAPDEVVRERPEQVEPVVRSTSVCPYVGGEARAASRIGVLAINGVAEPEWQPPADDLVDSPDEAPEPDETEQSDDAQDAEETEQSDETEDADENDEAADSEQSEKTAEPIVVRRLAGPDEEPDPLMSMAERGVPAGRAVEGGNPAPYAVTAEGPLAPGVVAEQYMLAQGPDLRGLVTAACTTPAREHWFVGATTEAGERGRLILTNASATPAVVSVSLWDDVGSVEAAGTKDISIPPRSQEVLLLDALASEAEQIGVRVRASQGRITAAVDFRNTAEGEPNGISMIPGAAAPATTVVVPGVPGHGQRSLHILAPGDTDAIVNLRVFGVDGPFSPLDHDVVTVPAGTAISVPIGEAIGDTPAAIALDSDEEITAAVRVVSSDDDERPDIAYTAAAESLPAGPTAAVLSRDTSSLTSRLLLTAVGDMGGRVTVTTLDEDGSVLDEQTEDITAGSTADIELASGDDTTWAFTVVQPAAPGTIVGVREIAGSDDDGRLLDLMPLIAPELTVQVPEVAGELPTGLRPPGHTEQR